MLNHFTISRRNTGHWDVNSDDGRLFRLRGGPGAWTILDERHERARGPDLVFRSPGAAMSYVCSELMHELVVAEGQEPTVIEAWNVRGRQRPSH